MTICPTPARLIHVRPRSTSRLVCTPSTGYVKSVRREFTLYGTTAAKVSAVRAITACYGSRGALEPPCLATRANTCTDVLHVFACCTVSASRRAQGIHIFSDGTLWTLEKTVFAVRSPHWAVGAVVARSAETSRPQVRERQARILSRRAQHRGRPWCRK